jgi:hypothetical protein
MLILDNLSIINKNPHPKEEQTYLCPRIPGRTNWVTKPIALAKKVLMPLNQRPTPQHTACDKKIKVTRDP